MKAPLTDIEYIEYYAKRLKNNSKYFKQQKEFIESQMKISSSLFLRRFSKEDFNANAREYLKNIGML